MKIDVSTKAEHKLFEDQMLTMIRNLNNDLVSLAKLVMQQQDRIKILENKINHNLNTIISNNNMGI